MIFKQKNIEINENFAKIYILEYVSSANQSPSSPPPKPDKIRHAASQNSTRNTKFHPSTLKFSKILMSAQLF